MTADERLEEIVQQSRAHNKTTKAVSAAITKAVGNDPDLLEAVNRRAQKIAADRKKTAKCPMVITIGKRKFAPWDVVTDEETGEKRTLAAEIVKQVAEGKRGKTFVERELDRIFLEQWPEGPQLP